MRVVLLSAGLATTFVAAASAAEPLYQRVSEAACRTISTDELGAMQLCRGPDGTPFIIADYDLRISVVFGGVDEGSEPRFESFGNFNNIGETIEWRMEAGRAVAAILRWHLDAAEGGPGGQVLVVSKVGAGASPGCVAAYVDALANPDANTLARDAAERIVANVECGTHVPLYYGTRGPRAGDPMR
jgi:hypothetical protein